MSSNVTSKPLFPQALTTSFAHRLSQSNNSLFSNLSTSRTTKRQATSKVNYSEDYPDLDFDFEDSNNNQNSINNINNNIHNINNTTNGLLNNGLQILDLNGALNQFSTDNNFNNINNNNNNTNLNHDQENGSDSNEDNDYDYIEDDKDSGEIDDEKNDATYEDPNAAYDVYKNLILNSNNRSINLSNYYGNKEAPHELPKINFTPFEIMSNYSNPEIIIPIKLKINTSNAVINDNILWNLNETLITPEIYSSIMSSELDLNKNIESNITNQIKDQIQSFKDLLANPNNSIIDQFLLNEKEFHVVLDISANIGEDFYTDKIEWNLLDNSFTPEMFAKTVCMDIGLKPEFETAIAVAIYDEIYKFKRELIENPQQVSQNIDSLPFFNMINPDDASKSIVQGLRYDTKKYGEEFSPTVEKLNEWEIEKRETEKERNLRRRKRETLRVVSGVVR
ncbi:Chromatin structure remodeling complex protein sfh1 [Pichia californica]|uniref:Chromatin structure remodeling complex protein sfh1 n=1 Tax=Pichia californica TaxID=460514 RepID=A0A9P6WGG7_9ASCO|nr:Chromatin structure remodeling complex protein sfh1 [[Candida] californica]KAG0686745.1 Chromatin structure remodeling complex protein sfh1 [[Candida] californica]